MSRCAILCGSAPEDFRQQKLVAMHDFLVSEAGGAWQESEIVLFPNGVHELMLESILNGAFDDATEDDGAVTLYLCAEREADLHAELSDCAVGGVEVVRLGKDEIRKDVIAYYTELAERLGVRFRVVYEADGELVRESELGYERVACERIG